MPQLDGLRTIAVGAVLAQHYRVTDYGAGYGVHLFFVLSGFLITRILLAERENVSEMGITRTRAFRQFYVRRMLRIFPLYYLVVLAGIAFNIGYAREYAPWLLTYTINLKMAAQGWYVANFAHFWSLAIEEQYYLAWPWLILLLPRRLLVRAALITTAIGPLFRLLLLIGWRFDLTDANGLWGYIGTPSALDSLGVGSLIAILMNAEASARLLRRAMRWSVPVIAGTATLILQFADLGVADNVLQDTAAAVFFGWLIYTASRGFTGITGRVLSAAPMVFIGKISYGVYVYHPLVPSAVARFAPYLGLRPPSAVWASALLYTCLTVAVATISWYSFERPINQLKRKFPYATARTTEQR
jgi:peptidoglycan/LPS O-acetylase OafA/YrhL